MDIERIENLLDGAGVVFEKMGDNTWKLSPGPKRDIHAVLVCVKDEFTKGGDLLKVRADITELAPGTDADTLKEIFRKNRDMGHGAFALRDDKTLCFVDTLQLKNCDQNEMDATLDWLMKAEDIFNMNVDRSKSPYMDEYRFSKD